MGRRSCACALLLPALFVTAALTLACDPTTSVYFENRRGSAVEVHKGGSTLFTVSPGKTASFGSNKMELEWRGKIGAYAPHGTLVFDRTYTYAQLKALDFRIAIE